MHRFRDFRGFREIVKLAEIRGRGRGQYNVAGRGRGQYNVAGRGRGQYNVTGRGRGQYNVAGRGRGQYNVACRELLCFIRRSRRVKQGRLLVVEN